MMTDAMTCGTPMMIGMGLAATLLVATLVLTSAAAIRVLRSDMSASDRSRFPDRQTGAL